MLVCVGFYACQKTDSEPFQQIDFRSFIPTKDTISYRLDSLHFNPITSNYDTFSIQLILILNNKTLVKDTSSHTFTWLQKLEIGTKTLDFGDAYYLRDKVYLSQKNNTELLFTLPLNVTSQWINYSKYFNDNIFYKFGLINATGIYQNINYDSVFSVVKYNINNKVQEEYEECFYRPSLGLIHRIEQHLEKDFETGKTLSGYRIELHLE
jgi:hypothetical protein